MLTAEQKSGIDAILAAADLKRNDDVDDEENLERAVRIVEDVYDALGFRPAAATLIDSRLQDLIFVDWIAVDPFDLCEVLTEDIGKLSSAELADFYCFLIELANENDPDSAEKPCYEYAVEAAYQAIKILEAKLNENQGDAYHLLMILRAAHCGTQFNDEGYRTEVALDDLIAGGRMLEKLLKATEA
jgi:hypothetical protein